MRWGACARHTADCEPPQDSGPERIHWLPSLCPIIATHGSAMGHLSALWLVGTPPHRAALPDNVAACTAHKRPCCVCQGWEGHNAPPYKYAYDKLRRGSRAHIPNPRLGIAGERPRHTSPCPRIPCRALP